MLPFLLNLSFFIKHYEILSWPPSCPAMYEVIRSFSAIKTKTHLPFAFDARFRVCTLLICEYATLTRRIRATFSKGQKREKHNRGRPDQKTLKVDMTLVHKLFFSNKVKSVFVSAERVRRWDYEIGSFCMMNGWWMLWNVNLLKIITCRYS